MTKYKLKTTLCIFLLACLILTGCSETEQPQDNTKSTYASYDGDPISPTLTKIDMPFDIEKREGEKNLNTPVFCYSDKDGFIVANIYEYMMTATETIYPEMRTEGLYRYDYESQNITAYDIRSKDATIYSAVPYGEGLFYVEQFLSGSDGNDVEGYPWNLVYYDGKDKKIIDSGYSSSWCSTEIILIRGVPVYVCEKVNADNITEIQINKITNMEIETIDSMYNFENYSIVETNGEFYLLDLYDKGNETPVLVEGNENKVFIKREMSGGICSCALTSDYAVVSTGGQDVFERKVLAIPFDDAEEIEIPQIKKWWRMTGSNGKYCVAVDDGFHPYYIDVEKSVVGRIMLPEEIDPSTAEAYTAKSFEPAGKDKFILGLDYEDYYIMDLNDV